MKNATDTGSSNAIKKMHKYYAIREIVRLASLLPKKVGDGIINALNQTK